MTRNHGAGALMLDSARAGDRDVGAEMTAFSSRATRGSPLGLRRSGNWRAKN